ncbi:MAG: 5'-nucleotidase C-terminal domain-containing protein [Bacteroidota bacterium]
MRLVFWVFWLWVLGACSHKINMHSRTKNLGLDQSYASKMEISSMIQPYSDSLTAEMGEVIGRADTSFDLSYPNSNLMNWAADAILQQETQTVKLREPVIVLLNAGGLRSSINRGEITVGDLYKLMPFDNVVAWVRLPVERIPEIEKNLTQQAKGVALANATFQKGTLKVSNLLPEHTHIHVITSDYLAFGGDKMTFFLQPESVNISQRNMRDVFIQAVKQQGTLTNRTEKRYIP